jgi:hypothetical protein
MFLEVLDVPIGEPCQSAEFPAVSPVRKILNCKPKPEAFFLGTKLP